MTDHNHTPYNDFNKQFIMLYINHARVASVERTKENLAYLHSQFCLYLINEDITGDLHFSVLGCRHPTRKRRPGATKAAC